MATSPWARAQPLSGIRLYRPSARQGIRHVSCDPLAAASNLSAIGEYICTKNQQVDGKLRVDKYFVVEMTVQDHELDKYGVVNNAVYASYIFKAREEMLVSLEIDPGWIISTGNVMALSELHLNYIMPLKRGQKFVVKIRVPQIKGARIFLEHLIETLPDRKLILVATATAICLNMDHRPTRIFPEVSAKLLRFFSSNDG